jgi:hypothetical protein
MLLHRRLVQNRLERLTSGVGAETGRLENALRARLSEIDPLSGQPLASALSGLAFGEGGWLQQLDNHAGEPVQHATCGQLLALAGRYSAAADQFAAAAAILPDDGLAAAQWVPSELQIRLWHEEVWWRLAAGEVGRARDLARTFSAHTSSRSREGAFFREVGAIPVEFE